MIRCSHPLPDCALANLDTRAGKTVKPVVSEGGVGVPMILGC